MGIRVPMNSNRHRPQIHLKVHHEQMREGGPEEGTIQVGVQAVAWPVDVSAARTKDLHSVTARNITEANREGHLTLAHHTRTTAKVTTEILLFLQKAVMYTIYHLDCTIADRPGGVMMNRWWRRPYKSVAAVSVSAVGESQSYSPELSESTPYI